MKCPPRNVQSPQGFIDCQRIKEDEQGFPNSSTKYHSSYKQGHKLFIRTLIKLFIISEGFKHKI